MAATIFAPNTTSFPTPARPVSRPGLAAAVPTGVAAKPGWIERLALWADAHPPVHHRLGRWTMHR